MAVCPIDAVASDTLHRLVWGNQHAELDKVLAQMHDKLVPDAKDGHVPFVDQKYRGMTALTLAAQLGHKECVEVLLKYWADTLTSSDIGYYPLQEATALGDRNIMRTILLRRHQQLQQLWIVRQPVLAAALHTDMPDFFLEMDWHFKSWIPFLSKLCPSDRCRIWKRGNRLRVDSTLMGIEVEKLNWVRGNISFVFHVNDVNGRMVVLDHDRRIYEEIDKIREFTEEEIEEDLNMRLNTQLYSGRMRKPKNSDGEKKIVFVRQQAGLFGLGGDREERIGVYNTQVYDVHDIEVVAKYRREHLVARKASTDKGGAPCNGGGKAAGGEGGGLDSPESLGSEELLATLEKPETQVEEMISDARKSLLQFVPSLPRPRLPAITESEFFVSTAVPLPYLHVGRRMEQSEKSKKFQVSVWVADNFPLTIQQLVPFFEIMTLGNKNFEKLQEFISLDLPPGFPVRIEIPLFAFLAAQITFLNFQNWSPDQVPQPAFAGDAHAAWFEVPQDYVPGVVLKNILKDN